MSNTVSYEDGHLIVAAIRVFDKQNGHPPTPDEIAAMLGQPSEWTRVLVGALERHGVLLGVESAFTIRVEIKDHLALEQLTKASDMTGFDEELKEFSAQKQQEEEALGDLFQKGDAEKKKRMAGLKEQLDSFKTDKKDAGNLFDDFPEKS
ncbi:MAG: hypothetical protein HKN21_06495 [Candidatus Eisenbacteria bacterium]|uniref:Uncharacterized protein n=1 Tax=Eiseniibacteriota bacterium TaxID=2212470 RepID=A0A7Y2E729_UNCEI|nr:hypothetical protein [Candidatus Eisenbacteria bacterium]